MWDLNDNHKLLKERLVKVSRKEEKKVKYIFKFLNILF